MYYSVKETENFTQILNNCAADFGDAPAFIQNKGGVTVEIGYNAFINRIRSAGTFFTENNLGSSNIVICGKNSIEWCTAYLAASIYCKNAAPADKELPCDDIIDIIRRANADAIVCDIDIYNKISVRLPESLIIFGTDFENDKVISFQSICKNQNPLPLKEKNPDEKSIMLFTSGTTGKSKAVALTQKNICSDISAITKIVYIGKGERTLSLLPLHHTYECSITFLCCLSRGVTICYGGKLARIYKDVAEYSPDILIIVPLMLEAFHKKIKPFIETDKEKAKSLLGGKLRLLVCGAAMTDGKILDDFASIGIKAIQGYGLTECSPIVICNSDKDFIPDSVGKPIPSAQVKIINKDENNIGEICVKGPMVTPGYYDDNGNITSPADEDGWFRTGDLGFCDKEGYYYITGRLKNVIVTPNGKNIYPEEIEAKLSAYPEIKEVLVYEGRDIRNSNAVCADIVSDESEEIIGEIIKQVNEGNAPYKAIKSFNIVTELAKNSSHKIIRNK